MAGAAAARRRRRLNFRARLTLWPLLSASNACCTLCWLQTRRAGASKTCCTHVCRVESSIWHNIKSAPGARVRAGLQGGELGPLRPALPLCRSGRHRPAAVEPEGEPRQRITARRSWPPNNGAERGCIGRSLCARLGRALRQGRGWKAAKVHHLMVALARSRR